MVDDHRTFTDLVEVALTAEHGFCSVGAAHDAPAARRLVEELLPDLVLMDVNLGAEDGIALTAELTESHATLRVVILTGYVDQKVMRRAAAAGACALLPKNGSLPDLLAVLRSARPGGLVVNPRLLSTLVQETDIGGSALPASELTRREHAVLELLADGLDVRRIARELGISISTCRGYVKALLYKLDAHSQLEAVVAAGTRGLIEGPRARARAR